MFDELKKYKNSGHFFFYQGSTLSEVSKAVAELPGVYYILQLGKGKIELVYIGKSEIISQGAIGKMQTLKDAINNKSEGVNWQEFLSRKINHENIDGLDIYSFVTFDKTRNDLPGYVQGLLMQRYFEMHAELPAWNKSF